MSASVNIRTLATAEGTEVENTVTEGSLATHTLAVGSLTPGKVFLFSGSVIVNDNNSTDTLAIGVRCGTSSTVGSNGGGLGPAIDVADNDIAVVIGTLHVESTTRATLQWVSYGPDAGTVAAGGGGHAVITIDQVTAHRLDLTAKWSVAHADNEAASRGWTVIELAG